MPRPRDRARHVPVRLLPRSLAAVALLGAALASAARGADPECGSDGCNFARVYTGTITFESKLRAPEYSRTASYVVTFSGGRVTCEGVVTESRDGGWQGPVHGEAEQVRIRLPGYAAAGSGRYSIEARCGEPVFDEEAVVIDRVAARDLATLEGSATRPHPLVDPENAVQGTQTIRWNLTTDARLRADAGGPYLVVRGAPVVLDGTRSRGATLTYRWRFLPGDCPAGVANAGAALDGAKAPVTLLCSGEVELTVSDGKASDRATAPVTVAPRRGEGWTTEFEHDPEEGRLKDRSPTVRRTSDVGAKDDEWVGQFVAGRNVCARTGEASGRLTLEPFAEKGTRDGRGYELAQVGDAGPFRGVWYVGAYRTDVRRKTLVNEFLLPGGTPTRGGRFYDENVARGLDVDGYLRAIRAHEGLKDPKGVLGHSGRIAQSIAKDDPALRVEPLMDRDRVALRDRVDAALERADVRLCKDSEDPLPLIWRGKLAFPRDDLAGWIVADVEIGGPAYHAYYDAMGSCEAEGKAP